MLKLKFAKINKPGVQKASGDGGKNFQKLISEGWGDFIKHQRVHKHEYKVAVNSEGHAACWYQLFASNENVVDTLHRKFHGSVLRKIDKLLIGLESTLKFNFSWVKLGIIYFTGIDALQLYYKMEIALP